MKTCRVNPMTLSGFMDYLREHGIPCSPNSAKAMIDAGVFGNAAYACKTDDGKTTYLIIPSRLARWFEDNADEVRVYEEDDG